MDLQLIKCPGCNKLYNENIHLPKTLKCGHTLCLSCSNSLSKNQVPFCCKHMNVNFIGQGNQQTNTLIQNYIKKQNQIEYGFSSSNESLKNKSQQTSSLKKITDNIGSLAKDLESEKITYFKGIERRIGNIEQTVINEYDLVNFQHLNQLLTKKKQVIANLESSIQNYQIKLQAKKEKNYQQSQEILELKNLQNQKTGDHEKELNSRLSLVLQIQKQNELLSSQKQQIIELQSHLSQTESQLHMAEIKIQEKQFRKAYSTQLEKKDLTVFNKVAQLQEYIQTLELKVFELEHQKQKIQQENLNCTKELNCIKQQEKGMLQQEKYISQEIKEKINEIEQLKKQIYINEEQAIKIESNYQQINFTNQQLQKIIADQKSEIQKIKNTDLKPQVNINQFEKLQTQNQQFKNEINQLKNNIEQMQTDQDHSNSIIKSFEQNKIKQEKFIAQLQNEKQGTQNYQAQQMVNEIQNLKNNLQQLQQGCQCKIIEQQIQELLDFINEYSCSQGKGVIHRNRKDFLENSLLNKFKVAIFQLKSILLDKIDTKEKSLLLSTSEIDTFRTPNSHRQLVKRGKSRGEQLKQQILGLSHNNSSQINETLKYINNSKESSRSISNHGRLISQTPQEHFNDPEQISLRLETEKRLMKLKKQWNLDFDLDRKYKTLKKGQRQESRFNRQVERFLDS